jgi:hypothetical protein
LCRYSAEEEKLRKRKKEADAKKGKFGNVSSKIDLDWWVDIVASAGERGDAKEIFLGFNMT